MAINLSFQPSAAAIGGAGLMAGNADFNRWRAQQLAQQWAMGVGAAQNAQQMNLSRMNALSQIAAGQQQQQQQQAFELQKLPMQAQLESQQQAFQSNLAGQNQTNQALLQGSLHAQQSTQDFGEQQSLQNLQMQENMQRDQAQRQAQIEGQQTVASYQDRLKQGEQDRTLFQNPLDQHMKMMEQAQKSGYSFAPDQQQQVEGLKSDISKMQQSVANQTLSMGDALPQMRQKVGQLNSITPSQPPPETTEQKIDKNIVMGIRGPDGQVLKGTEGTPFTVDAKTGTPMVVRGWKGEEAPAFDEEGNPVFQSEKARGQWLKNQKSEGDVELQAFHEAQKAVMNEKRAAGFGYGVGPDGMPIPGFEEQRLQFYEAQFAQRLARRPSGAGAVPAGTPHPAGDPGGKPPQQAPPEAGMNGQSQPPPAAAQQPSAISNPAIQATLNGQDPTQSLRQSMQPRQLSPQELAHEHAKIMATMPDQYKSLMQKYEQNGATQQANAIPVLWEFQRRNQGKPINQWPRHEVLEYMKLVSIVPDLAGTPQAPPQPSQAGERMGGSRR